MHANGYVYWPLGENSGSINDMYGPPLAITKVFPYFWPVL